MTGAQEANQFLWGALTMASAITGLYFLKFWKTSHDRLFIFFALAFWILALNWVVLAFTHPQPETRHYSFLIRLLAFALIVVAILDKNRHRRRSG